MDYIGWIVLGVSAYAALVTGLILYGDRYLHQHQDCRNEKNRKTK